MKRALFAIVTLAFAASLLLLLPVTAQAFDDGTQCMQAQSGKHDFESRNYVAPTCTTEGSRTWVCRRCGHEATETIPMTEHRIQLQTDVEPTCTTAGSATRRCVDCGITASRPQTLPALGHNYQVIEQVPDTCETAGYTLSACSRCKETLREEGKPLGHSPVTLPGVSATCTASGLTEGSQCSRCGRILTAQETIPALGHNWSTRGEVAQEPTCTADGVMRYPCQR